MDTKRVQGVLNHEWTLMDTNGLNHETHERHEKIQNHEWTLMNTKEYRTTNGHEWTRILR